MRDVTITITATVDDDWLCALDEERAGEDPSDGVLNAILKDEVSTHLRNVGRAVQIKTVKVSHDDGQ